MNYEALVTITFTYHTENQAKLNVCLVKFNSVPVGTRQGSFKVKARGMFKGAKVVRGPDWEWKESDGTSEMEGEVTEITGWSDDTLNDAVRVAWKNGPKGNIYRLGSNGKVRLLNFCRTRILFHHFLVVLIFFSTFSLDSANLFIRETMLI